MRAAASPRFRGLVVVVVLAATATLSAPLAGQGWVVEASAGSTIHEALPVAAGDALAAAIGIRRDGPMWVHLSAGLPLGSGTLPWMAASAGTRLHPRVLRGFGLDAAVHAYGYDDAATNTTGGGVTAEMLPAFRYDLRDARFELRSGVVHHRSTFLDETPGRTVHHSDVRALVSRGGSRFIAEGRFVAAREASYPFAGALVERDLGSSTVWVSAGRWFTDRIEGDGWAVGGRLPLGSRTELNASFRSDSDDPVHRTGRRSGWSIGLHRSIGPALRRTRTDLSPTIREQTVTFRLPAAASQAPAVGGDFTGWEPVPMLRDGDEWILTLSVPPGFYRFAFHHGDGEWFVPAGMPGRVDDGFGGESATLLVP
jgi:hypothetical protein